MGNCGVGFAPVRPRPARVADRADGGRRGHPGRRAVRGHPLGLGDLPRVPRRPRRPCPRDRHRHPGAARRGAGLRDGRAGRPQRAGHARGHRGDGRHRAGRHRGRRARLLDVAHARPPGHRRRAGARAPSPPRTSCSASAPCSASSAPACSSSPRPAPWARTSRPRAGGRLDAPPVRRVGRPVTFALLQNNADPDQWRRLLDLAGGRRRGRGGAAAGARAHGVDPARLPDVPPVQLHRPPGARPASASSPWDEQVRRIQAEPDLRSALVAESRRWRTTRSSTGFMHPDRIYLLGDPPDYEPDPSGVGQRHRPGRGRRRVGELLDLMLVDGGRELLNSPVANYSDGNPRRRARDAAAPDLRVRARRRRRPRRADLRRLHHDVPAHPLGPRPGRGPAAARDWPSTR